MHKIEASQLIKNRKAIDEMRERISKYEKEELPARIVNMECAKSVFKVETIALLKKLTGDFKESEREELSRVFSERLELLVEINKKILNGLEKLEGEQLREYMKLSGRSELNPEEFVKNRIGRIKNEIEGFERLSDAVAKISQTMRELEEAHSIKTALNEFREMIKTKKFD